MERDGLAIEPASGSVIAAPFEGTAREWDRFVRSCAGWTHFHLYGWKQILERSFGHECSYLAVRDEQGALEAVLPLVRVKSLLFGHFLVSMPFVNYGGPLGSERAVGALVGSAAEMSETSGVGLLELRSRHPLSVPLPVSHRKITVLLDLPEGSPEPLWQGLKPKIRSQIRRPRKEGVEVRFGLEQLGAFFSVFSRHMRDLGTPTMPLEFFREVRTVFPDDVWIGCAYLDEAPVAAGLGFRWESELEMTWAAALRSHSRIAPNMLLYWSFMERAIQEGVRTFNFGRCSPGSGTHRFKQQWGGRDERLWWYQKGDGKRSQTPAPDDGVYAVGPRLWRRLPLPVANALGPHIVRYLP